MERLTPARMGFEVKDPRPRLISAYAGIGILTSRNRTSPISIGGGPFGAVLEFKTHSSSHRAFKESCRWCGVNSP